MLHSRAGALLLAAVISCAAAGAAKDTHKVKRTVLAWAGPVCILAATEASLAHYTDSYRSIAETGLIDIWSPVAFYVEPSSPSYFGTIDNLTAGLQIFKGMPGVSVQPLLGGPGQFLHGKAVWGPELIGPLRPLLRNATIQAAFVEAAAAAVVEHELDGLNFDLEPSDCATGNCTAEDALGFARLMTLLKRRLAQLGGRAARAVVSADTGQSIVASTGYVNPNTSECDRFATMNTYYDGPSYDIALPRDLAISGPDKFVLGVCPECSGQEGYNETVRRMAMAEDLGVRNIGIWQGSDMTGFGHAMVWNNELSRWKAGLGKCDLDKHERRTPCAVPGIERPDRDACEAAACCYTDDAAAGGACHRPHAAKEVPPDKCDPVVGSLKKPCAPNGVVRPDRLACEAAGCCFTTGGKARYGDCRYPMVPPNISGHVLP